MREITVKTIPKEKGHSLHGGPQKESESESEKKKSYKTDAVLTAYLNNTQNDNNGLKKCPIHVRGKGGKRK